MAEVKPQDWSRVAIALVHWPVVDKAGSVVVTNVTNLDVHDIARASRVYGIEKYFIVNKLADQQSFVSRLLDHWRTGYGVKFNPMRRTALMGIEVAETVEKARKAWEEHCGESCYLVSTSAREVQSVPPISFKGLREKIMSGEDSKPILLIYGTGYGMTQELLESCDFLLEPIQGRPPEDYRHLSVRSAVSISLDRLLGKW